jgi:ComF family protein
MSLGNTLRKALYCAAAYISLENCRNCKTTVNNRHPLKPPQGLCIQCWLKLLKTSTPMHTSITLPTGTILVQAAGTHFGLLRKLIIKLKQTEDPLLAHDLSHLVIKNAPIDLERQFEVPIAGPRNLLLIPMPLHNKRLFNRGFNQSELLSKALSSALGLALSNKALKRVRDTRSQRGLRKEQRRTNMQAAFAARSDLVKGKTIILIDDVCTSGATMQAASAALFEAGAADVRGVCIAIAPLLYQN